MNTLPEEVIAFKGELMLLSWRESHNNGATVTFQLADVSDLEAFKRMTIRKGKRAGQRLMAALVEVGDDETPVVQEKKGGPLSKNAAQMCDVPEFQKFLQQRHKAEWEFMSMPPSERAANIVRYNVCNVNSRAELDHNPEAAKRWHELIGEYRSWIVENGIAL